MDNGKISTILITLAGVLLAAVIANPTILESLMGEYYIRYGAAVLAILIAIYNAYYPRNPSVAGADTVKLEEGV
jgi:ABC-type Fe3+-siderophore transport system permease subunit